MSLHCLDAAVDQERMDIIARLENERRNTDWFVNDRFGMFIHFGLYSVICRGEWVQSKECIPNEAYDRYFDSFNADLFDPERWAAIAKSAGMRYAVLTAKHHDGFCLFDSELTDFKSTNTATKRDLVRDYVEAFRAAGLKVGIYYSLLDWHHPEYAIDSIHPLRDNPGTKTRDQREYIAYLHGQVRELLTNYGQIDILWFDFSFDDKGPEDWGAADLIGLVTSLQPGIIMNSRLDRGHLDAHESQYTGDFFTPEQFLPADCLVSSDGGSAIWEACVTINDNWGYCRDDKNFKSERELVRDMVECVSKGGNLLLNVGPNGRGEIQPECVQILSGVGEWLRLNGNSIYGCREAGLPKPQWGRWTRNGDVLYAHVFDPPVGPVELAGWEGKVKSARMLSDGSEIAIDKPWMRSDRTGDAYINLPSRAALDPYDTVVEIHLVPGTLAAQ